MQLDLKHLRQILVIARTGSFAKAADELAISQPALSRSLQSLEQRLGARLFDRGRNGVAPTPTGTVLLAHAQTLLKQAAEAERDIDLLLGRAAGHLRIGAGPYPAAISVGTAVARLVQQYPGLSIDVQVNDWDELIRLVLAAQLDLAVAELMPVEFDERLSVERLPTHPGSYFCRAGHPLTLSGTVTLAELKRFPLAATVLPHRLRHVAARRRSSTAKAAKEGSTLPWIHVNTFDLARQIVLESDAIGLAVPDQIADSVEAGVLVLLDTDVAGLNTNYGIIRLGGRTLSPSAEAFLEILRDVEASVTLARSRARSSARSRAPAARPS